MSRDSSNLDDISKRFYMLKEQQILESLEEQMITKQQES